MYVKTISRNSTKSAQPNEQPSWPTTAAAVNIQPKIPGVQYYCRKNKWDSSHTDWVFLLLRKPIRPKQVHQQESASAIKARVGARYFKASALRDQSQPVRSSFGYHTARRQVPFFSKHLKAAAVLCAACAAVLSCLWRVL